MYIYLNKIVVLPRARMYTEANYMTTHGINLLSILEL